MTMLDIKEWALLYGQTLYQGNCFKLWELVPDHSVDFICTDPPYGVLGKTQSWDVRPDFHVLGQEFSRLIKPNGQIAIFCSFITAIEICLGFQPYFDFRFYWIWAKPSAPPVNQYRPTNDTEFILVFKVKGAKVRDLTFNLEELKTEGEPYTRQGGKSQNANPTRGGGGNLPEVFINESGKRYPRSVLRFPNKPCMPKAEQTAHPTQKPLVLLEYIIRGLTNPGDLILDSFFGSGSTLVAAQRLRRQGIGFEMMPEYFLMALGRIYRQPLERDRVKADPKLLGLLQGKESYWRKVRKHY